MSPRRARTRANAAEIHVAVARRLAATNVRYTKNRRAVIDTLVDVRQPMTVDQIRSRLAAPLSSIYRTLGVFEEAGLVHRIAHANGDYARYELAESLLGHHHHLACAKCGAMTDITLTDELEADLDRVLRSLARRQRFELESHRLDVVGTCATCSIPHRSTTNPASKT